MTSAVAQLSSQGEGRWAIQGALTLAASTMLAGRGPELLRGASTVEIDLAGVTRIDSTAVALLLEWLRQAHDARVTLRFSHCPEDLLAIARVGGVHDLLPV